MEFNTAVNRLQEHGYEAFIKLRNNLYILKIEDEQIILLHLRRIYDKKLNKIRHKFIYKFALNKIPHRFKKMGWSKYHTDFH